MNDQGQAALPPGSFVRPRPVARPAGRVFAFPFAGAGAVAYHSWGAVLPPEIELVALQYRGRGRLRDMAAPTCIEDLVADCHAIVTTFLDAPFCLFGHSLGATVAFEVASRLRSAGQRMPDALVVSGRAAPQLPFPPGRSRSMSDEEFMVHLVRYGGMREEILQSPEMMAMVLPLLRADLGALDDWRHSPQAPLGVPILALGGDGDGTVTPEALQAWRGMTSVGFEARVLAGGHFYFQDQVPAVVDILRAFMQRNGAVGWRAA